MPRSSSCSLAHPVRSALVRGGVVALAALGALGCAPAEEAPSHLAEGRAASTRAAGALDRVLPWGDGPEAVGWRAPAEEFRGDGPSGIAIAPDGRVVVADRLNRRLVAVDTDRIEVLHAIPEDGEHLAVDAEGASVVFSPYRARSWVFSPKGAPRGEVDVPRGVGDVTAVALGPSLRVEVSTAFQERFVVGSPSAPLRADEVLRSKREGAIAESADGPAMVAVRSADGEATLRRTKDGRRSGPEDVVARLGEADAVRLVGRARGLAAVVVERVAQPAEALQVSRALLVVDAATGAVAGERELPIGAWVPRESITFGGDPPAVAFMVPTEAGLRVVRLDLAAVAAEGGAK